MANCTGLNMKMSLFGALWIFRGSLNAASDNISSSHGKDSPWWMMDPGEDGSVDKWRCKLLLLEADSNLTLTCQLRLRLCFTEHSGEDRSSYLFRGQQWLMCYCVETRHSSKSEILGDFRGPWTGVKKHVPNPVLCLLTPRASRNFPFLPCKEDPCATLLSLL